MTYKPCFISLKRTKAGSLRRPNKTFLIFWISNSHSSCVEVIHNKMPSSMVLEKWETPMNDDNLRTILLMYLIFASGGSQVCWGKLNSQKTSHRGQNHFWWTKMHLCIDGTMTSRGKKVLVEKMGLDLINNARQTARELSVRAFLDQFAFSSLFNAMMGLII